MPTTIIRLETKKVIDKILDMLQAIIDNHRLASEVIKNADLNLALSVLENDEIIDAESLDIASELEFLITKAPVDRDLRRTIAYISIARELERIGDYAKHVAKFVIKQNGKVALSSISRIKAVHDIFFTDMLSKIGEVLRSENVTKAIDIVRIDKKVDKLVAETRLNVIKSISERSKVVQDINERVFVINVVNSLERAADHIVNICEMVIYIDSGSHTHLI